MPKKKTEHYVNNKDFLEGLKGFFASVDKSYQDNFNQSITWKADGFNPEPEEWDDFNPVKWAAEVEHREEYEKWLKRKKCELIRKERAKKWEGKPVITRYIGDCFLKIATHLSYKPNFVNYMYREDMISDGVENCVQYIFNFEPTISENPFAYFTQMTHFAFLRRISKEKKQLEIKTKIIERTGFDEVMMVDNSLLSGNSSDYNSIKDNIQYKNNR